MTFLVYVRNVLQPDGMSAKLVYDERGGKPDLGAADRAAGMLAWHALPPADVGLGLDMPRRLYPAPGAAAQARAA